LVDYVTVFDAASHPLRGWTDVAPGLIFVAIGGALVLFPRFAEAIPFHGPQALKRPFDWAFLSFGVILTATLSMSVFGGNLVEGAALRRGDCRLVEGRVEHIETTRTRGGYREKGEVAGVPFEYAATEIQGGFRTPASSGGPMEEGLQVRICERAGHILHLEIAGR
jgi:hypothetical protein